LIKTIVKIVIALALANAAVRGGMVAMSYYQLKDAAQQALTFGANAPTTALANEVLDKAAELEVPLDPENLEVTRNGNRTVISAFYTQPVEFVPTYVYPLELTFTVEGYTLTGLR